MPWIIGCGGCGLVIILGFVAALLIPAIARHRGGGSGDTKTYTVVQDSLSPTLQEHYIPFSFSYPADWQVTERGNSAEGMNFVKVEKAKDGNTAENFAVGYLTYTEGQEGNQALLEQVLSQFQQQFAQQFPGFQRVSDDHITLDGHAGTGFRFTAKVNNVDVFGRVDVVPVANGRGLSLIMLGTPQGSDLTSVNDLGEKGGIPTILRSFKIGDAPAGEASQGTTGTTGTTDDTTSSAPAGTSVDESSKPTDKPASEEPSQQQGDTLPQIKRIEPLNP